MRFAIATAGLALIAMWVRQCIAERKRRERIENRRMIDAPVQWWGQR